MALGSNDAGDAFLNMPYVYRLSGELNAEALEKALCEIIRRHEALRTIFTEIDGFPFQIIKDGFPAQFLTEDMRGKAIDDLSQRTAVMLLGERAMPFDLATGPLFRIKLLRLTELESLLLITMHHIMGDHWSMQVFRRELIDLYEAYSQGRESPFSRLPRQFADHAVWEKQLLGSGLLNSQLDYWKKQLSEPLSELNFAENIARNVELEFRICHQLVEWDETMLKKIKAVANRQHCTTFMVILAALNLVVHSLSGQVDIRVGTLLANRRRRECEGAIGHFLNTVVLRTKLEPNASFGQLLRQVRDTTLAALANQEIPFEQLAHILETKDMIKRESLFQVLLSYQATTSQTVTLSGGLTLASLGWQLPVTDSEAMLTACDLVVNIKETETILKGSISCKANSFDNEVAVSIVERFTEILKQVVVAPNIDNSVIGDSVGA